MPQSTAGRAFIEPGRSDCALPLFVNVEHAVVGNELHAILAKEQVSRLDFEIAAAIGSFCVAQLGCMVLQTNRAVFFVGSDSDAKQSL
jgi:hypothetical protein